MVAADGQRPGLFDRLLRPYAPRPVPDFAPPPRQLAPGIWELERRLGFPGGARLPSRTTLIRLEAGGLVVISPPPLVGPDAGSAIDDLGPVRYVVAPNTFHYVWLAAFHTRHPEARLLVAPGLPARVPALTGAEEIGPATAALFSGQIELAVLGPVRGVSEVVFFHVPSATLILSDLAFHVTRFPRALDRIAWRLSGIPARFGPARTSRSMLLRDRDAAARCLVQVARWPLRRIVMAHGEVVEQGAREELEKAFAEYGFPVAG